MCVANMIGSKNFNSQPHKEADAGFKRFYRRRTHFNSQPHKEADPGSPDTTQNIDLNFNSQPHKEADK